MSRVSFENYGVRASAGVAPTEAAGRYAFQRDAERRILPDVIRKLRPGPGDRLLEIGCGPGALAIPLSFLVQHTVVVDHPAMIARVLARSGEREIESLAGNFLDLDLQQTFSCILVYSVLHLLADEGEVTAFVDRATALLAPGGRLLLGDLPNADRKRRFLSSPAGARSDAQWRERVSRAGAGEPVQALALQADPETVTVDDALVLRLLSRLREQGLESQLLAQPQDLPFGNTREDILAVRYGD